MGAPRLHSVPFRASPTWCAPRPSCRGRTACTTPRREAGLRQHSLVVEIVLPGHVGHKRLHLQHNSSQAGGDGGSSGYPIAQMCTSGGAAPSAHPEPHPPLSLAQGSLGLSTMTQTAGGTAAAHPPASLRRPLLCTAPHPRRPLARRPCLRRHVVLDEPELDARRRALGGRQHHNLLQPLVPGGGGGGGGGDPWWWRWSAAVARYAVVRVCQGVLAIRRRDCWQRLHPCRRGAPVQGSTAPMDHAAHTAASLGRLGAEPHMCPDATVNTWMRPSSASAGTAGSDPASALPAHEETLLQSEPLSPALQ